MVKIVYPDQKPRMKTADGQEFIFCLMRRRWVVLTPEEWVRQNFLLYLTEVLHYPASLIAVERQIEITGMKKRFDIVVFDTEAKPFMIVECKEMNVPLAEPVFEQAIRYNAVIGAKLLVITNGSYTRAFEQRNGQMHELNQLSPI